MKDYNKLRIVLIILLVISILLGAYMSLRDSNNNEEVECSEECKD